MIARILGLELGRVQSFPASFICYGGKLDKEGVRERTG